MQLIVTRKSQPRRDRLHALRPVGAEQPTPIKRSPALARAAPYHVEKRLQPPIEVVSKEGRPGHSSGSATSQLDTKPHRDETSAKVVLVFENKFQLPVSTKTVRGLARVHPARIVSGYESDHSSYPAGEQCLS